MGRPKRLYPTGKYRLRIRGGKAQSDKQYPVALEYTWNRQVVRKATNITCTVENWSISGNQGRGGVKPSYGPEAKRINAVLVAKVDKIDALLAEYYQKHPEELSLEIIADFLNDKPVVTREDKGKDFVELTLERLASDYSRNRIGRSRYQNGKSGMNMFQEFLRSTKRGTYKPDGIYVGEITVELIEAYIEWRREIKKNGDATINHSLTPILKACAYAAEMKMIDYAINVRIQDMRITPKASLVDDGEFDGKSLSDEELEKVIDYYRECKETRRREFIEMFLFSFHACGLRVVDVMTLQWSHVDLEKRELRKVMIKTGKRHIIPLSEFAINILKEWKTKRGNSKFVFNLVKDSLDIEDDEAIYKARNNATKCINQSLTVVGEQLGLKFPLTMHVARHTFAVMALNKGLSMSVVSRLLGHGSTDITEKVYARFLPETLSTELGKLTEELSHFQL